MRGLLMAGLLLLVMGSNGNAATVPDCVGDTVATCEAELTAAGLLKGTESMAYNEAIDKGLVASTVPEGGTTVADGATIALVLSGGPQGQGIWNMTFWGIMRAFLVGTYIGLFIKLTNRS